MPVITVILSQQTAHASNWTILEKDHAIVSNFKGCRVSQKAPALPAKSLGELITV
jgi:hypothetical protein